MIFSVCKFAEGSDSGLMGNTLSSANQVRYWNTGYLIFTGGGSSVVQSVSKDTLNIVDWTRNSGDKTFFENGSDVGGANDNTTTLTVNTVGTIGSGAKSNFELSELIVIPAYDETNKELVEGYLAWKYSLEGNLPVGHAYKNYPPTT